MHRSSLIVAITAVLIASSAVLSGQDRLATAQPALTLATLEQLALTNNPTMAQAASEIEAARGRAQQAGLLPNPTVGYTASEVSRGPVINGGEHGLFVEQTIPLGGKLGLSRRIFEREVTQAEALRDVQRQRLMTDVRVQFYTVLAAERRVEIRRELARLGDEAVGVSRQLYNTGAADRPDVLASEIEARQMQIAFEAAQNDRFRVWRQLAALVNDISLTPRPLDGSIEASPPDLQREAVLRQLMSGSPELLAARSALARERAALVRARREPMPDLIIRGGPRYNRERLETNGLPVGWEAAFDVGLTIPLFNRNQGGIAESRAQVGRAEQEVTRLELSLQSRAADVFNEYLTNLRNAEAYKTEIVPRAEESYRLYLARYREAAAAYPQVLVAQRTLFQVSDEYVRSAEMAWTAALQVQGLLIGGGLDASPRVGDTLGTGGQASRPSMGGMNGMSGSNRQ